MSNWRERLMMNPDGIQEFSSEGMAASRIMKSLGSTTKNIGMACKRFGIEYNEEEGSFQRAVKIFREVYADAWMVDFFDVMTGTSPAAIYDDLLADQRTGIIFFRFKGKQEMTAFVKGLQLNTSALGQLVIRPGIRYIREHNDMQLWEQDPVLLLKSFSKTNKEE